jgi:hypothetical protein
MPWVNVTRRAGGLAACGVLALPVVAQAAASFATAPDVPDFGTPALTLNGTTQTVQKQMNAFAVSQAAGLLSGFSLTVNSVASGNDSTGVFQQYCPTASAPCGGDAAGYVSGGHTLPSGSLTLNITGATWTQTAGLGGNTPVFAQCNGSSTCPLDTTSAWTVATQSASLLALLATWTTSWPATSLTLTIKPTTYALTKPGEVYHLDLLWTLTTT